MNGIASVQELLFHVSSRQIRPHVLSAWRWDRRRDATNMRTLLREPDKRPAPRSSRAGDKTVSRVLLKVTHPGQDADCICTRTLTFISHCIKRRAPLRRIRNRSRAKCAVLFIVCNVLPPLNRGVKKKKKKKTTSKIVQVSVAWF